MKNSLVSIVIPTYKRPDIIVRAVESALSQSYPNIEIIVVDDNDPSFPERKSTEKVMEQYSNNPKVMYIQHERNKNGSAARNTGWKHAHGEYITYLDDDDELSPQKIEKQVDCLESLDDSWGACYTAYHIIRPDGSILRSANHIEGNVYVKALMRTMYVGSGSNLLLRKSAVDSVGGYDERFKRNQDIEFMTRIFERYKLAFVNQDLLLIHLDGNRPSRPYSFECEVTDFYINVFSSRINALDKKQRHNVVAVIALDSARVACYYHEYMSAVKLLWKNRVTITELIKYFCYLFKRYITKTSFGFSL